MLLIFLICVFSPFGCIGSPPGLPPFQPFKPQRKSPVLMEQNQHIIPYTNDPNSHTYWNCHNIPPNMTLCKSVGYSRMVLPNFLQHESLREVIQQANVWVALVNTDCHPDIQRFLCSLYAPVCLKSHQESKIPPCWELCDQVRNACLPRMRLFGFDWPDIVQCNQFPKLVESMCIPPQENTAVKCAPCEQAVKLENIASSYCMADVVLKMAIKDIAPTSDRGSLRISLSPKSRVLKLARRDGTIATNKDVHRLWKRSRHRRHQQRSIPLQTLTETGGKINKSPPRWLRATDFQRHWSQQGTRSWRHSLSLNQTSRRATSRRDRRFRRNPNGFAQDLDGIQELQLGCSACHSLTSYANDMRGSNSGKERWLAMGRRLKEGDAYTNRVQITFLMTWDRTSPEFRHALNAIRKQPVSKLCPESTAPSPSENTKASRSVSSELSDAPNLKLPKLPAMNSQTVSAPVIKNIVRETDKRTEESVPSIPSNPLIHTRSAPTNNNLRQFPGHRAPRLPYDNAMRTWSQNRWARQPTWHPTWNQHPYQNNIKDIRRRRRREQRLWRKKNRLNSVKPPNKQHYLLPSRLTKLRTQPINPYLDEDSKEYTNTHWLK